MAWLDRIEDRRTQRLMHDLRRTAMLARDIAQDRLADYARDAGGVARRTASDAADYGRDAAQDALTYGRRTAADLAHSDGAELAREAARYYASRAGEVATQLAEYGRHEGAILARAAGDRAARAGRALRTDPLPVIIGAVGIALLASLLFSHRRD